ncbi:hypothetical protein LCGC14_1023560 [marine sediment metagenome]|uniref:Putative regulatory protein FmdB zinc ribbon domain-containing protein n=1 Tax=marine sediment metagenome TaxID=412755 RepID=A0A0F9R2I6_9ZZZZ
MPLYEFRCSECLEKEDALVDMADRNKPRLHSCGAVMDRLVSIPRLAFIRAYPKDKILDTLNEEARHPSINGAPVRSERSRKALASGLDYVRPLEDKVFAGF